MNILIVENETSAVFDEVFCITDNCMAWNLQ